MSCETVTIACIHHCVTFFNQVHPLDYCSTYHVKCVKMLSEREVLFSFSCVMEFLLHWVKISQILGQQLMHSQKLLYFVIQQFAELIRIWHNFRKKRISKIEVIKKYQLQNMLANNLTNSDPPNKKLQNRSDANVHTE